MLLLLLLQVSIYVVIICPTFGCRISTDHVELYYIIQLYLLYIYIYVYYVIHVSRLLQELNNNIVDT